MVVGEGLFGLSDTGRLRTLPKELSKFLLSRHIEGCSPATLDAYERRIKYMFNHTDKPVDKIEKSDVELYILSLKNKNCSPHYIESCYRAINTFFIWLVNEGYLTQSPMKNMKKPKKPKYAKEFITEQQFQALLSVCPSRDYRGIRNRAWLWLLWTTGARFSELANLQLSDLDWQQNRIRVFGKGAKERYVPFTKEAQTMVYKYIAVRPEGFTALWIGEEKKPMKFGGLSKATRLMYERAGFKVKDLHHVFRRSWAYRNLKAGVPIKYVQLCGGWSSVTMLEQYVAMMNSEDALNSDKIKWV